MENLSENAERVWKVLSHYPKGTIYKELMRVTGQSKGYVYLALKELESKGFVEHKQPFWKITGKPSTEKPSKFGFWKDRSERKRLEQEKALKEHLADRWTLMEVAGETFPELEIYKHIAKTEKKNRKELGLE